MVEQLQRGRERYSRRAWRDAWRALSLADQASALEGRDLELLATAAYLIGRGDDYLSALARAHHAYLDTGERRRAVRCAFWLGLQLLLQGERGRGTGWLARAQRVLEGERAECPEHGYLMLPAGEQQLYAGDFDRAYDTAVRATSIGDRFREPDLLACALHLQGRALLGQGEIERGLALLDEAMIAVSAGELSPLMTGLVYCSVIGACRQVYALDRSQQWTDALARWCDEQPDMVAFTESCLVHRAEVKQLHGAWQDALDEAARACERFSKGIDQVLPVAAFYQIAEVLRLRGDFRAAEEAYRTASRRGWEPQPGLALLRLAQGRREVAAAAIRRVATAATDRLQRIDLLPAYLEIMLAVDDLTEARAACRELEQMAETLGADVVRAMAAHARGAVELAAGVPDAAVAPLRFAMQAWQRLRAPYEAARVRELLGAACRILGDDEGAELELDAARSAFEQLGAMPDLARLDALRTPTARPSGLTARELQVLRLIAAGKTNKAIAADLGLSEKTIERHVSNIFNKLNVATRAAATACAYENKLI